MERNRLCEVSSDRSAQQSSRKEWRSRGLTHGWVEVRARDRASDEGTHHDGAGP